MCTMCKSKTYGQDQPEARKADLERLQKVLDSRKAKN